MSRWSVERTGTSRYGDAELRLRKETDGERAEVEVLVPGGQDWAILRELAETANGGMGAVEDDTLPRESAGEEDVRILVMNRVAEQAGLAPQVAASLLLAGGAGFVAVNWDRAAIARLRPEWDSGTCHACLDDIQKTLAGEDSGAVMERLLSAMVTAWERGEQGPHALVATRALAQQPEPNPWEGGDGGMAP